VKILFLTLNPIESAATRYRMLQYFPYFEQKGYECKLYTFFSSQAQKIIYSNQLIGKVNVILSAFIHFQALVNELNNYDALFISREVLPFDQSFLVRILKKCRVPFVYDFDDAVFLRARNGFIRMFENQKSIVHLIENARYVIAGNQHLLNFARQHNYNSTYIPTSVDTNAYRISMNHRHGDIATLGWIGSHSTVKYLYTLRDALRELALRHPIRLLVVGAKKKVNFPGIELVNKTWTLKEELNYFEEIDIGLAPLIENEWALGKCGFKVIQYMATGVPCVASRVGVHKEIISDGHNGFLCSDAKEWVDKISLLITSSHLREKFCFNGRKSVEETFSVQANINQYLNLFRNIGSGKPVFTISIDEESKL